MEGKGPKVPGCKVVLLGDSGVGKTCIISRYIQGTFEKNCTSTNGASYCSKNVKFENFGKNLLLDIWDTAGQEKYKSLTKFFYKDAAVAILVYDITRKDSFENLKNYWHKQLLENGEKNVVLGVAGNKCDLYENEAVSEKEGQDYGHSINAYFKLVSAKNNISIDEFFNSMVEKFVESNFMDDLLPKYVNDKNIVKKIQKMKLEKNKKSNENKKKKCC